MSKSTKVLIAIAALGWGLLALFYGYGVFALYQSGDGALSDFVVPGIPLGALAVAIVVPMILFACRLDEVRVCFCDVFCGCSAPCVHLHARSDALLIGEW